MCGIAGIVSNNTQLVQQQKLQLMANVLQHRGPDGEGFWINNKHTVGFAHRRLSIIDLSNAAAQPMHYKNRYTIVFNGEIYNYIELRNELKKLGYHFSTQSDTEVILAAYAEYGDGCVEYFDGMFAFAIWDNEYEELFAARDRFGEKPFYYFFDGVQLIFASEMKALWAAGIGKEINNTMLLNYLTVGFVSNPANAEETFYSNIQKLPPASTLTYAIDDSDIIINQYWHVDKEKEINISDEQQIHERFQELLSQSVKRRLRSDVTVGTSLSGGLDSSSIIATIQQITSNTKHQTNTLQKTFSAIFPGFKKDESAYINKVVQKFNVQNFTVTPTSNDFVNDFQKLLYHQEEPFQSSSIYAQYKVYQLAKQHDVTVLLDGQGADETLAGYTKYYHWYWQQLLSNFQLGKLSKEKNGAKQNENNIEWGINNYAAAFLPSMTAKQLQNKLVKQVQQNDWLTNDFIHINLQTTAFEKPVVKNLNDILFYNTFNNGLEDLLRYADRNSMAHSCEVRLPFLSHELVTFIFSLPAHFKIADGFTKHILRLAMNNNLPNDIVWRKDKVGFEPPQQQWLQHKQTIEMVHAAKQKLVAKGIVQKQILDKPVQATSAHEGNNVDWWMLCAGAMI